MVVAEDTAETGVVLAPARRALLKVPTASATTASVTRGRYTVPGMDTAEAGKEDTGRITAMEVWKANTATVTIVNVRMGLDRTATGNSAGEEEEITSKEALLKWTLKCTA